MSTTRAQEVTCPYCRTPQEVLLAESVNVQRAASWQRAVLDGTLHRFRCPVCAMSFKVERDLLYSDLLAGVLIGAFAPTRFPERAHLEAQLAETWAQTVSIEAPAAVRASFEGPGPRVVFGLAALREKVVCFGAGLDDRLVEAMKLTLLEGIAGRAEAGVADLVLVEVPPAEEALLFQPVGPSGEMVGGALLRAPASMYADLLATREQVIGLLPALFEGLWVHWRSARPDGLGRDTLPTGHPEVKA